MNSNFARSVRKLQRAEMHAVVCVAVERYQAAGSRVTSGLPPALDRSELSSNLEQLRPAFGSLYQC